MKEKRFNLLLLTKGRTQFYTALYWMKKQINLKQFPIKGNKRLIYTKKIQTKD